MPSARRIRRVLRLATPLVGLVLHCHCNGAQAGRGPRLDNGDYRLTSGDVSLDVDPQVGARVVALSLGGQNWLTSSQANAINYGSTFWPSPQSDWSWPPPPEIDNLPYAASAAGGALSFTGTPGAALSLAVDKTIAPAGAGGAIAVSYTIRNTGASARMVAPWEVTRVHPQGIIFFPTGGGSYSADAGPPLPTQQASGVTWFDAGTASIAASIKFFADGSRGWLAHASGGLLFVKKFTDTPPSAAAHGESEIELYVSGDRAYIELEVQGAYQAVAPGASLPWSVRWFLVPIPSGVDASVGSASLVAFVDAL